MGCAVRDSDEKSTTEFGRDAKWIRDSARDSAGPAQPDVLTDVSTGKKCVRPVAEQVRQAAKRVHQTSTTASFARAAEAVMYGGATITALIEYMMSAEARDKFNRDCLAHPEHSVEALASWLREGMKEAGVAVGVDAVQAVVSQACKLLVSKAALLQGALAEAVAWIAKKALTQMAVVGLIVNVLVSVTEACICGNGRMPDVGAICKIAMNTLTAAAGMQLTALLAPLGGFIAVCAGCALAWGLATSLTAIGKLAEAPRRLAGRWLWSAVTRQPNQAHIPCWQIQHMPLLDEVRQHAECMLCPISKHVYVEPCNLHGYIYERKAVEEWILQHHTHPATEYTVYLSNIRPCQYMSDLVCKFAKQHALRVL